MNMSNSLDEYNKDLREKSGAVRSKDPLVCFLYLLMRDHVPAGVISKIANDSKTNTDGHIYTNGFIAEFAKYIAERLRNE